MTDPVVLLGTQSNGETLPVQVNSLGQLVAQGLQGEEGPTGPEGPPGGSFPLPADPYEGALLGWLNGELAWVGSAPIPIPPGVFGPITAWDGDNGILSIEGVVPETVGNGVYVWQVDNQGNRYTAASNVSREWTTTCDNPQAFYSFAPVEFMFNGDLSAICRTQERSGRMYFTFETPVTSSIMLYGGCGADSNDPGQKAYVNFGLPDQKEITLVGTTSDGTGGTAFSGTFQTLEVFSINGAYPHMRGIALDGNLLTDTSMSSNLRVNQRLSDSQILGVSNNPAGFEVGQYLKVEPQVVAPWVLYGNDPTSLIDHLRRG